MASTFEEAISGHQSGGPNKLQNYICLSSMNSRIPQAFENLIQTLKMFIRAAHHNNVIDIHGSGLLISSLEHCSGRRDSER